MNEQAHVELLKDYLRQIGFPMKETGGELITHCPLNGCDRDSRQGEAHFYVNLQTGQYDCKKCGEQGNVITLAQILNDRGDAYLWERLQEGKSKPAKPRFTTLVDKCHKSLPSEIRTYLKEKRGWTDAVIDKYKIGWFYLNGCHWITYPVKDEEGKYKFFKLRQDPKMGSQKFLYPAGTNAQLYDYESLQSDAERVVICEGESDKLLLESKGICAVTTTAGAGTFKDDWLPLFKKDKRYYIVYDTDEAGIRGAQKVAGKLYHYGIEDIQVVTLPKREATSDEPKAEEKKVDITDYFMQLGGTVEDLFSKYARKYPPEIDASKFKELVFEDIDRVLSLTIKGDSANKVATFCTLLNAYTDDAQLNISFNGPSSGGKSHTTIEVERYFPAEDVIELMSASPTAFFHENGIYDKERNVITVNLSRKILVFLDMPNNMLLERLRPLLSHDSKVLQTKITDKNQSGGNRTKTVEIIGFPSVVFCTASFNIDEQEATRFLLLSPEISQSKLKEGIQQSILKSTNREEYENMLKASEERQLLIERIVAIKQEKIQDVRIADRSIIEDRFIHNSKHYKPKHQRDVKKVIALAKSFALLNCFFRKREGKIIVANENDMLQALKIWDQISVSQELGISPHVYNFYFDIIVPEFNRKNAENREQGYDKEVGISRKEIRKKHFQFYSRPISEGMLKQILFMLETAGLIEIEKDEDGDRRAFLIKPVLLEEERKRQEEQRLEDEFNSLTS